MPDKNDHASMPGLGFAGRIARAFIDSKLTPLIVVTSVLLGAAAVILLPREEEPQIKVPMIDVLVSMPGFSAKEVEQRATRPHLYPNAVARSDLAPEDNLLAYRLLVTELTLIPSTALNTEALNARFGTPSKVEHPEEKKTLLYYPASGLVATLVEGEPAELHFSNPAGPS